jgi:GPH family glycoside/pentoside/hexuronide:cation symporter
VAFLAAFPVAVLGILPFTIVAEIAELDSRRTGEQKEGMFYAVRTFSDMLGQTLGVMIFAIFTIFGKDTGNDLGIRLSALMGMIVCIIAGVIFLFFKEIKKRQLCWKAALVVILVSTRKKENKLLSANIK